MKLRGFMLVAVALPILLASDAEAASCAKGSLTIQRIHTIKHKSDCREARKVVHDLEYYEYRQDRIAIFRRGRHHYTIRDDYHCTQVVKTRWSQQAQHPVAKAHGTCVYKRQSRTRFYFKSNGWYA